MKLREVNRSAAVAWGHSTATPLLASATIAGTMTDGFESTGTLEFFAVDISQDGDLQPIASIATNEKVHKLVWGTAVELPNAQCELGILAGAMESGVISLWNPVPIIGQTEQAPLVALAEKHSGAVKGLDFNPFQGSLLASGGLHGEVFIWDLTTVVPYAPGSQKSPSGDSDVNSIGWNNEFRHILATATASGMAVVWDLKAKRAVLSFKDSHTPSLSCLAWHPTTSTQLATSSDDDSNPVLHMWDLRNTFAPLHTLRGHTAGVKSLSWCHSDPNILVSCGKDHRTLCWDLSSSRVVGELSTSEGWSLDIQWSPVLTSVVARSSLPGKIELFSVNDLPQQHTASDAFASGSAAQKTKAPLPLPPAWLGRPASVSFSFGGKLVSVPSQQTKGQKPSLIHIRHIVTEPNLVEQAEGLHQVVKSKQFTQFCLEKAKKAETSSSPQEKSLWDFLRVLFEKNARSELRSHLGFDREFVSKEVAEYIQKLSINDTDSSSSISGNSESTTATKQEPEPASPPSPTTTTEIAPVEGVAKLFDDQKSSIDFATLTQQLPLPSSTSASNAGASSSSTSTPKITFSLSDNTEAIITKSLLVGDFQGAVDCCFSVGRLADALVLAAFGGQELLKQTHARYLAKQNSSFMHMVSKIAKKEFMDLVEGSSLSDWKEVLTILCTYAKPEHFQQLCGLLGSRLLASGLPNIHNALLCFVCAGDMEKAVDVWLSARTNDHTPASATGLSDGDLEDLVEKSVVFAFAIDQKILVPKLAPYFTKYAQRLASQGLLELAHYYISLAADLSNNESPATQLHHRIQAAVTTSSLTTTTTTAPSIPATATTPHATPGSTTASLSRASPSPTQHGPPLTPAVATPFVKPVAMVPTSLVGGHPPPVTTLMQPAPPTSVLTGVRPPALPPTPPLPTGVVPSSGRVVSPPVTVSPGFTTASGAPFLPAAGPQRGVLPTPSVPLTSPPVYGVPPPTVLPPTSIATAPTVAPVGPPPLRGAAPSVFPPPPIFAGAPDPAAHVHARFEPAPAPAPPPVTAPPTNLHAPKARHHDESHAQEASTVDNSQLVNQIQSFLVELQGKRPEHQQHVDDASSRLQELINKLQKNELPPAAAHLVSDFFTALSQQDLGQAHQVYTKINNDFYSAVGSKAMVGLKRLQSLVHQ